MRTRTCISQCELETSAPSTLSIDRDGRSSSTTSSPSCNKRTSSAPHWEVVETDHPTRTGLPHRCRRDAQSPSEAIRDARIASASEKAWISDQATHDACEQVAALAYVTNNQRQLMQTNACADYQKIREPTTDNYKHRSEKYPRIDPRSENSECN